MGGRRLLFVGTPPPADPVRGEALPKPGDRFADKYTIVRMVGEGGVGVVYEAMHDRLEKRIALKVLRSEARKAGEWVTRFEREARTAVKLRGANVARVFDVDSLPDGTPYMVMELLEGQDLADELHERKTIPVAEAVRYILEACSAMAEAHAYGIVHRDLTPGNLFLAKVGDRRVIKVLDFGISKVSDDRGVNVTTMDSALGTPQYMSPEQIRSTSQVDPRADVWSLGVILFEMLTGMPPFWGNNASAIIAAVIADPPRPLRALRPDLPDELVAVVMKALEKYPSNRFQKVEELAAALAPFTPALQPLPIDDPPSMPTSERLLQRAWATPQTPSVPELVADVTGDAVMEPPRRPRSARTTWLLVSASGIALGAVLAAVAVSRSAPGGASSPAAQPPGPVATPSFSPPPVETTSQPAPAASDDSGPAASPSSASPAPAKAPIPTPHAGLGGGRDTPPPELSSPRTAAPQPKPPPRTRDNPLHL